MICNVLIGMILYLSCLLQYNSAVFWEHSASKMMQASFAARMWYTTCHLCYDGSWYVNSQWWLKVYIRQWNLMKSVTVCCVHTSNCVMTCWCAMQEEWQHIPDAGYQENFSIIEAYNDPHLQPEMRQHDAARLFLEHFPHDLILCFVCEYFLCSWHVYIICILHTYFYLWVTAQLSVIV